MAERKIFEPEKLEKKLVTLSDAEMQLFKFMTGRPNGAILTYATDKLIAQLLEEKGLLTIEPGDKVMIPKPVQKSYGIIWTDELEEANKKQNWMYKCLEAGMNFYGVMTWEVLGKLFRLKYKDATDEEIKKYFEDTPVNFQWFMELGDKLVVNGYEENDYYKQLEEMQGDVSYYIPKEEEVEELFDQGSLISRESHAALRDFIVETFDCDADVAAIRIKELYDAANDHVRVNDAADAFAASDENGRFAFPSDEVHYKFIEKYMEMTRECRTRDNRGHDYYEMVALMSLKNRAGLAKQDQKREPVRRGAKIGRNDPCPCGSGKKYKNCCGRNLS